MRDLSAEKRLRREPEMSPTKIKYGKEKRFSHQKNVEVWRELSGRNKFSPVEQYVTLADTSSEEYESMMDLSILDNPSQYHMVNRDMEKLTILKKRYPLVPADNFHHGDWSIVMNCGPLCHHGGIMYIDTMSEPDNTRPIASTMLAAAMNNCGPQTLICMNLCYTNPRRSKALSLDKFFENLKKHSLPKWKMIESADNQTAFTPPKTSVTQMITFYFWREN